MNKLLLFLALMLVSAPAALAANSIDERELGEASRYAREHDFSRSYQHFHKMAQRGCPYSQCALGIMYQRGIGRRKDSARAKYWYEKSARQGLPDAEHRLGLMHLSGDGIVRNVEQGAQWLEKAARHGVVEAQYELGKLDIGERSAQAFNEGKMWLQKAAGQGFHEAQELVAKLPDLPNREAPPGSGVEQGMQGLQKSWTGYVDLVNTLESVSSQASK